jgi:hypothetical protein
MANRSNSSMAISPSGRSVYIERATLERSCALAGATSAAALRLCTAPAVRKVAIGPLCVPQPSLRVLLPAAKSPLQPLARFLLIYDVYHCQNAVECQTAAQVLYQAARF